MAWQVLNKTALIIGRMGQATAEYTMAYRIRRYFETSPLAWIAKDLSSIQDKNDFVQLLSEKTVLCVFGLHALHCGKLLKDSPVPYAVIFRGPDVFEDSKVPEYLDIMTLTVLNARFLIATNRAIEKRVLELWPNIDKDKLILILPGIVTYPVSQQTLFFLDKYQIDSDARLFLLITRIEPSRDPLQIIPAFTHWHQMHEVKRPFLIIIGPITDAEYSRKFMSVIDGCPGVFYVGIRTLHETHSLMTASFAVINSAVQSGTNTTLLEAMSLGIPVICRDLANRPPIVEHENNGLVYTFSEDFVTKADVLVNNPEVRESIIRNAKEFINENHNPEVEKKRYSGLAAEMSKTTCLQRSSGDDDSHERRVRFRIFGEGDDENEDEEAGTSEEEDGETESSGSETGSGDKPEPEEGEVDRSDSANDGFNKVDGVDSAESNGKDVINGNTDRENGVTADKETSADLAPNTAGNSNSGSGMWLIGNSLVTNDSGDKVSPLPSVDSGGRPKSRLDKVENIVKSNLASTASASFVKVPLSKKNSCPAAMQRERNEDDKATAALKTKLKSTSGVSGTGSPPSDAVLLKDGVADIPVSSKSRRERSGSRHRHGTKSSAVGGRSKDSTATASMIDTDAVRSTASVISSSGSKSKKKSSKSSKDSGSKTKSSGSRSGKSHKLLVKSETA